MDVYPIYKSYVTFWWYDIYQNGKGILLYCTACDNRIAFVERIRTWQQHAIVVHWLFHDTCILLSWANGDTSHAIEKKCCWMQWKWYCYYASHSHSLYYYRVVEILFVGHDIAKGNTGTAEEERNVAVRVQLSRTTPTKSNPRERQPRMPQRMK